MRLLCRIRASCASAPPSPLSSASLLSSFPVFCGARLSHLAAVSPATNKKEFLESFKTKKWCCDCYSW
jgi:hypothetical protein